MTLTHARAIPDIVAELRATFRGGRTRPLEWRRAQLTGIVSMLTEREADFARALRTDLRRSATEAWIGDIAPVTGEAEYALRHLRSWVKPTSVGTPMGLKPAKAWHEPEPLGVVLIIAPWNYPVYLLLGPLIGAVAAGNCAVLKPSELAPACARLLAELVPCYLDGDAIRVVQGGVPETEQLLDQGFDHCVFTGSSKVGKAIMTAAAKHLTPVTLELGGKSPAIVADDANLEVAARRIAWGKLLNSGQTCVAPDYVLVQRTVRDSFVAELDRAVDSLQGGASHAALPILDTAHAARIADLVTQSGGRIVRGGSIDTEGKQAPLTVIVDPAPDSALLREEIFGPVLPIVTVDSIDDAVAHVQQGPKPLAAYLFSESRATERRVLDEISAGGVVVNHLIYHLAVPGLPFGGIGNSGMGAYHGKWGFDTLSHRKAVLRKPTWFDPSIGYPPYSRLKQFVLRRLF